MADYVALNKMVRRHKAALTRARKKGPEAVIAAVDAAFAEFDEPGNIWPDTWHTWNVAREDARWELRRAQW
jgi:hypothetical protein